MRERRPERAVLARAADAHDRRVLDGHPLGVPAPQSKQTPLPGAERIANFGGLLGQQVGEVGCGGFHGHICVLAWDGGVFGAESR